MLTAPAVRRAGQNDVEHPVPLDARKQQILKAVVADYTRTGVPVGSQALALHLASWSSATIRNELAMLSEVGYLIQPHTSAGRVPSDLGYRYYVDFLMEEEDVPPAIRRQMEPFFSTLPGGLEEILETAATALAVVTDAVSLVTGPRALGTKVKHLDLVSLDPGHALLVLVLEGNLVRQHGLALRTPADQVALSALAASLNTALFGLDSAAIALLREQDGDELRDEVLADIVSFMASVDAQQDTLVLHDGVRNLLRQPEFGDVELLQQVIAVVEEERTLAALIAQLELDRGVQIMIGRENGVVELSRCSLVLTTYRAGGDRRGTIGVLGPTRMPYGQVAPRVRFVAQRVGRALERVLS
ncbi:MAG: heat-inducible transcription repressor HrcA [Candidatus Dormibacteraeota bacterium]|nr:heat-inducible transcription repressor HrcA [Candidatus Dormibacteraeota bacterium]